MDASKQKSQAAPPSNADATTPFFARFLEAQHLDAEAQAAVPTRSLKYPSDRDEDGDFDSHLLAKAAETKAGPSRMTLKYPSDRDEIDNVYYH
jgi:hypothetical protein